MRKPRRSVGAFVVGFTVVFILTGGAALTAGNGEGEFPGEIRRVIFTNITPDAAVTLLLEKIDEAEAAADEVSFATQSESEARAEVESYRQLAEQTRLMLDAVCAQERVPACPGAA